MTDARRNARKLDSEKHGDLLPKSLTDISSLKIDYAVKTENAEYLFRKEGIEGHPTGGSRNDVAVDGGVAPTKK